MANPVTGYDGSATVGGTNIVKIRKWSHKSERDKTEQGPWVGDSAKVTTIGGKLGTVEIEGDVPLAGDAGITALSTAYENGTTPTLILIAEDGFMVTYTTPAYTSFEIETEASGTQTWKVAAEGAYTIAQDT